MPIITSPYIPGTGNPDTAYEVVSTTPGAYSPYSPGELGGVFEWGNGITYRKVQLEASPNTTAAGQVCYWKDRPNNIVTNVAANGLLNSVAASNRNNVAGIIRGVVPANSQFFIAIRGRGIPVLEAGAGAAGMQLVANTGNNMDGLGVAIATAPPVKPMGTIVTGISGGKVTVNLDVPY